MDAFYASVEQRDNPELKGRPVAVGGRPESRGVVAAASYEARSFGVKSAMSMSKALRLCPDLTIIRPHFKKYREISSHIFSLYRSVTPLVEPISLDEAYLDVTNNKWGEHFATPIAKKLKQQIFNATQLTASAGVSSTKFIAKIASGWQKPDGLTIVPTQKVEQFLQNLPVEALWGVGPVTAKKLKRSGIIRLVDIRNFKASELKNIVGRQSDWLIKLSHGQDDRPVTPDRVIKSNGCENTFSEDLTDIDQITQEIERMAARAEEWLQHKNLAARTVTLKVRYSDFNTITRSQTERSPLSSPKSITNCAITLLQKTEAGVRPIRLLGVSVKNLLNPKMANETNPQYLPSLWDEHTEF
tara:strand:+ start:67585 stop:68655 length:1071 start_codon:yes stop_codon:yes gene_type:complete